MNIKIEGPIACFTRPEHKMERVSYECLTPTAALGILKSVFWKPQCDYMIRKIYIVSKGKLESYGVTKELIQKSGMGVLDSTLKSNVVLRDGAWIVEADVVLHTDKISDHKANSTVKYPAMLQKRLLKGKYFRAPYLGLASFPAKLTLLPKVTEADYDTTANFFIPGMLSGMCWEGAVPKASFKLAQVKNGILEVC